LDDDACAIPGKSNFEMVLVLVPRILIIEEEEGMMKAAWMEEMIDDDWVPIPMPGKNNGAIR